MHNEASSNILLCGMHRSGTSLTGKFFENIGYNFGDRDDLLQPKEFNKEGFWERKDVLKLNDKLLAIFGSSWDYPVHIQAYHIREIAIKNTLHLADDARDIIQKLETPFAIKDPRISLLLPFWQEIIKSCKVIIVVRNPLEVAKSLVKRNGISFHLALMLWQKYYQILLSHSHETEKFFLFNESLLKVDPSFISAIQKHLNLSRSSVVENAIQKSVNQSLVTYRDYPSPDKVLKASYHKEIIRIWQFMRKEAGYLNQEIKD